MSVNINSSSQAISIDVHNHFYPESYIKELKKGEAVAKVSKDSEGKLILAYEGDYNYIVEGNKDIGFRLEHMDQIGIRTQILSLTTPGAHVEERERGIRLAQLTNDDFAEISAKYPGRYYGLAALPLQDPEASARELRRAVQKLGLKGGTLFTNINGKTLDDPSFQVVFETARELDVPLFIHPTTPSPAVSYLDYRLAATVGFTVDTTMNIARLIFSGLLDRVPGLKLIASHLGGCLPYLAERLDRGYRVFPECQNIVKEPSAYIKDTYIDAVSFEPLAVDFAYKLLGADRIMVGSDYPHQIGDTTRCTAVIRGLNASDEEKEQMFHLNAKALFRL